MGIFIAYISDNQLRIYMLENEKRESEGKEKKLLLNTGIWKYSRHPNYFGEQLWWWSFALFSINCGQSWCVIGTLFNSIVLAIVTVMTENKMLKEWSPERVALYKDY